MKKREGFTLIELLVVISILTLLMALLLPVLHKARKQAQTVVCQNRQRDWSIMFAAYQSDNDGRFPDGSYSAWNEQEGQWEYRFLLWPCDMEVYSGSDLRDAMLCPTASKPVPPDAWRTRGTGVAAGTTFLAWRHNCSGEDIALAGVPRSTYVGSYATNTYLAGHNRFALGKIRPAALPAFFDSRVAQGALRGDDADEPPPCEDHEIGGDSYFYSAAVAINRHQGGLNMLFLDGAVRKVGVKELWTLKWSERFDTAGPWTKAGGALPEDWPRWLRKFREY